MLEAVGIEFAVGECITVLGVSFIWLEERGGEGHLHDDSAIDCDFDIITAHIFANSECLVCLVVIAMIMLE